MTTINCPHCTKDFDVEVKAIQSGHTMTTSKPFTESKGSDSLRNTPTVQDKEGLVNASQARNMKSKINIEGTLERTEASRTINLKSGGTMATVNAFIKDDSGEIKVTFWGDDVNKINDGVKIRIENGYTNTFKGEISLTKGKWGKLEILS